MTPLLALSLALSAAPPEALPGPQHVVERGGMRVQLQVRGAELVVEASAPTTGWVAVAFNTQPALAGARLVMVRVHPDGRVDAEVHRADPPHHARLMPPGIAEPLRELSGSEAGGVTRVRFVVPLAAATKDDVTLVPGQLLHLELAWSRSDDFQHHSAQRSGVDLVLERASRR